VLENVVRFESPIAARGMQKIWDWDESPKAVAR
jgi:hypothetical protein